MFGQGARVAFQPLGILLALTGLFRLLVGGHHGGFLQFLHGRLEFGKGARAGLDLVETPLHGFSEREAADPPIKAANQPGQFRRVHALPPFLVAQRAAAAFFAIAFR
jgi:hypothetical protein